MRKILEKRAAKLKARLKELESQTQVENITRDALSDIEAQVEEVTAELEEIDEAIAELPEEDVTELDDVVEDLGAAADAVVEDVEPTDESEPAVDEQARSRVLDIIGKGLSSRGEQAVSKLTKRSAFLRFLAGRIDQGQARSFGIAFNNGKVLVPEELSKEIISYLQEENPLRRLATVHSTKGTQGFPVQVKKAEANTVETERNTNEIPETEIEFTDVYLNPIEFDAIIKVTKKLTHMSDFDIEAIVIEELKKAYLRKETFWYYSNPKNSGSLAKKAVAFVPTGTNKYLKVIQLKNALATTMRGKAHWMINRAAQTELESILDNDGRPILKESGNEEFGYTLFNYPVEVTDYADKFDEGTSKFDPSVPVIYFGDFSYFHIQDVLGTLEIEKLDQLYAAVNKIGYKIYHINDGQLIYGPFETPVYSLDITA